MPWPGYRTGANRGIGETQCELLRRAFNSPSGQIVSPDPKTQNRQWCAAKRLHQRGLFERKRFGSDRWGWITVYEITPAGRRKYRESR